MCVKHKLRKFGLTCCSCVMFCSLIDVEVLLADAIVAEDLHSQELGKIRNQLEVLEPIKAIDPETNINGTISKRSQEEDDDDDDDDDDHHEHSLLLQSPIFFSL